MPVYVVAVALLMLAAVVLAADMDPNDSSDAAYTDDDYLVILGSSSTVFNVYKGDTGSGTWNPVPILTDAATIQAAVDFIKVNAGGIECTITFDGATSLAGLGTAVLYVGQAGITFNNTGTAWHASGVTIYGKLSTTYAITTNPGFITINDGVTLNSYVNVDYAIGTSTYSIINVANGKLNVMGGTLSTTTGRVVTNNTSGVLNVMGGTLTATTGWAIYGVGAGKITISEDPALPGSTLVTSGGGYTVDIFAVTGNTDVRLEVTGGTLQNTGAITSTNTVVRNASAGVVKVTGGTVQNTAGTSDLRTINNNSTGTVEISGGKVHNAGTNTQCRTIMSTGPVYVSGGTVSATGGPSILTSGGNSALTISGGTVSSANSHAIYAESGFATITIFDDPGIPGAPLVSGGGHGINIAATGATASDTMYVNISGGTVQTTLYNGLNAIYVNSPRAVVNIFGNALIQNNNPSSVAAGNSWVINNNHYGIIYISENAVIKDNSGSSANNIRLIQNGSVGTVNISGGTLTTAIGIALANQSAGAYNISGGRIISESNVAILCQGSGKITIFEDPPLMAPVVASGGPYTISISNITGNTNVRVEISGGVVRNFGSTASSCHAIYNNSSSKVDISGGTVDNYATGGWTVGDTWTIYNASTGTIDISGGVIMNDSSGTGSRVINNGAGGTINITQGSIIGRATTIHNASTGAVNISGGGVASIGGYAIYCQGVGKVTISTDDPDPGYTIISTNYIHSIYIANVVGDTSVRLEIRGGIVTNSGIPDELCYVIYNASAGVVNISGGEVSGAEEWIEYQVVFNAAAGTINISGGLVKSYSTEAQSKVVVNNAGGTVNVSGGTVSAGLATSIQNVSAGTVNVSGGRVMATTGTALINESTGAVNITGGEVSATSGKALHSKGTGKITISGPGTPLVTASGAYTVYVDNVPGDTAVRVEITAGTVRNTGTANNSSHAIHNASTSKVHIHGTALIQNTAATGNTWTVVNASTGTIIISGGTVQNLSTGNSRAVINTSSGVMIITGGTIQCGGNGKAVFNAVGLVFLGGAPQIVGTIYVSPATLAAITPMTAVVPNTPFNPEATTYDLELSSEGNGFVAVFDGTTFLNNFVYMNDSIYMLKDDGVDLILTIAVVITVGTTPDTLGIMPEVVDSNGLPVTGTAVGDKWTFRLEKDTNFTIFVPAVTTVGTTDWVFSGWADAPAAGNTRTIVGGVPSDREFTAVYKIPVVGPTMYYITATSDTGSAITPTGVVKVEKGKDQIFIFAAKEGYMIAEVWIDGLHLLTPEEMDLGRYTFTNVLANHTITVKSVPGSKGEVSLKIDIIEGRGYAMYSVDGGETFVKYTSVVKGLPKGVNIKVYAVADRGYDFDRWEIPEAVFTPELSFPNAQGPIHLELFFAGEEDGAQIPVLIIAIGALAVLIGAFLFFMVFWRPPRVVVKVKLLASGSAAPEGVRMVYEVNGKPKEPVRTDEKGVYVIKAAIGDELEILLLSKEGLTAVEKLPHKMRIEKRKSELSFTMQ